MYRRSWASSARDRRELRLADAVMNHTNQRFGRGDVRFGSRRDVFTLEQEQVRAPGQQSLGRHVEVMQDGVRTIIEASAVGRVDPDEAWSEGARPRQPRINAALGPMSM